MFIKKKLLSKNVLLTKNKEISFIKNLTLKSTRKKRKTCNFFQSDAILSRFTKNKRNINSNINNNHQTVAELDVGLFFERFISCESLSRSLPVAIERFPVRDAKSASSSPSRL